MAIVSQMPDILGDRQSGQDVRTQNVMACQAVANIVKSSLGPVGLDKMLVDDIGDVTITNDGATILKMLEVEHPAAKVLVELAELQDREVGDGTTSVVIVAAEFLKRANDLVRNKIHPTSIISGYRLAMREACKYVDEKLAVKVEKLGKDSLVNCAKTSMSSKLIGNDSDFFANLVVDAVHAIKTTNARGEVKYPIKGINVLKAHGKSARDSYLLNGYALNMGRAAQGMPSRIAPAKIACLDFNLQKTKMQMGIQVLVSDPRELEKIRQRESDITKERIEKVLKAGANVVLTSKGIDDMSLKMSDSKDLQNELDRNLSELRRLQAEVSRRDLEKEQNESLESLKSTLQRLEREKLELVTEKNELGAKLNSFLENKLEKNEADGSDFSNANKNEPNEVKMASKVSELEEILKETFKERDKALQELSRLKQHLLDKELEDEDKMDEDCKLIEELKTMTEYQRAQIFQLENVLLQEQTKMEELKKLKVDEFQQSNETIKGLKQKLADFTSIIDSKNVELQNLQTALGQYYAESEAKDRFGRELAVAREESAKYSELLNVANQYLETSKKENEDINARYSQTERTLSESRRSIHKLEEDNTKLRHALERSMTTLNRMSLDSDNYVDRRIVIKLLVTYFQRNHNKEVLDLMVRMLGFSEEDKQRIGFAQHSAGKGVVRGVLGLPGRLVGGIMGGNTALASSHASSEHQSFADLWVDFLLKETEARERREISDDAEMHSGEESGSSATAARVAVPARGARGLSERGHLTTNSRPNQASNPPAFVKQYQPSDPSDTEFSTVPLTPATSVSPSPRSLNLDRRRDIN